MKIKDRILKMLTLPRFLVYSMIISFLVANCSNDACYVIEQHPNGSDKTYMCIVNDQEEYFCYVEYFEDGNRKVEFCLKKGKLEGKRTFYHKSGNIESVYAYSNGLRHGLGKGFLEDGRKDYMNFYHFDVPLYGRYYRYDTTDIDYDPIYNAIVEVVADTVSLSQGVMDFKVSYPVPDSLVEQPFLLYMYDFKPLSLKDTTLHTPKYKDTLWVGKTLRGQIPLPQRGKQVFYGYIGEYDQEGEIHAYNPYEKVIEVVE